MKTFTTIALVLALASASLNAAGTDKKPKNVIFILSDDMGFNDPSFRGNNEISTPNLDALAYKGVLLDRYYTAPLCTPTRASILTGRYAHHIGMHHEVNWNHQPWGLGLDQKTMAEFFKEVGYDTHAIGKWHLGMHQKQYWPTNRGFDTFYGNLGVYVDYWIRDFKVPPSNFPPPANNYTAGYDFRYNEEIILRGEEDTYITDLLTKRAVDIVENSGDNPFFIYLAHTAMHRANDADPLAAKKEDWDLYGHITDPERRNYAAMVKSLDDNIGILVESLHKSKKLKDTIIVFTTDNGGPTKFRIVHPNTASNHPLRSCKGLTWEGGIRVNAIVYAPWLPQGEKREQYFQIADWLPTLNSLADAGIVFDRQLDGIDQSQMILNNAAGQREIVETLDPIYLTTSLIWKQWKLMNSSYIPLGGLIDFWLGSNNNVDHAADTYIQRVLDSKTAQALHHFHGPLKKSRIDAYRANVKVTCNNQPIVECKVLNAPCLFNVREDPCENKNLANDPNYADILADLKARLADAVTRVSPPRNLPGDYKSDPSLHDGVWTFWQDDYDV